MTREEKRIRMAELFLITLGISFAGWVWEVIHVSHLAGELVDRGFLYGPLCPIYGTTVLAVYLLVGTPREPQGLPAFCRGKGYRYPLYALTAIILPTLMELAVGLGFEALLGVRLWDYSHYRMTVSGHEIPLHFKGYIAVLISLLWIVILFAIMGFAVSLLLKLMGRLHPRVKQISAGVLGGVLAVDFIVSAVPALVTG